MLKCKDLTEKYGNDYIDHALPFRKKIAIKMHLLMCRHCKRFIHQLTISKRVLANKLKSSLNQSAYGETELNEAKSKAMAEKLRKIYSESKKK